MPESVSYVLLTAGITLLTFKPFFPSLLFADPRDLSLLLHHARGVFSVILSLLAVNVPVTKLRPSLLSPLLVEAVLDFWSRLELALDTEG